MLFHFGKKKEKAKANGAPNLSYGVISYLNKTDAEYMVAFSTKSMRVLQKYISRDCAVKVSRSIYSSVSKYFGAEKFRTTKWICVEEKNKILTVIKDVVFDKIKVGGCLSIGVAENYKEKWLVDLSDPERPIVNDISQADLD